MKSIKNYLVGSAVLIGVALVLTLAHIDVTRAVADEFKDVLVINTDSMPAKVRDVDNPARQPIQARGDCSDDEGGGCLVVIFSVPAGKRLVIEYASMRARITDDKVARMSIYTTTGGLEVVHYLIPTPPAPIVDRTTSSGQQVRLYADPETSVLVAGNPADSDGLANYSFVISGYLTDVQ